MTFGDPAWSGTEVETLSTMWGDGYSAGQIAKALGGGRTRSAVLGKVHRLKLGERSQTQPRAARMLKERPASPVHTTRALRREEPPALVLANGDFVTMLTVSDHTCRWPHGDPQDSDFHFCGQPPKAGRPYCEHHCERHKAPKAVKADIDAAAEGQKANAMFARAFGGA